MATVNLPDEESIFAAALECESADKRAAFLQVACGGDERLIKRIEALVRSHEGAGTFLNEPAAPAATLDQPARENIGAQIGPYKLRELLGEGGMGCVYVAEQEQPVRRKVALKIIKPGMDTRQVIARFEAERQTLALMDHPNIARVIDAGVVPGGSPGDSNAGGPQVPTSGRPYFVMELVRGVPITEFCDQRRLDPRQRLELFIQVCRAIQHAHQKGIIHRDIKPTNILVTLHDDIAVPKVIDFGIAKAMGDRLSEQTLYTAFNQMIGTPLYMSPEQAEMNALDVDTRSDVYSLGVLLYELLTGSTPFDSATLKAAGFDEMRRLIREVDPPRPSQRVSTLNAQAGSTVSHSRGVDERRLHRALRGELDWIVMKALEKDRGRRYETANAFAHDIERFLNDEIVLARPPSRLYRFRKLVRRNRLIFAASAAVGAALLIGAIVSTALAIRLKHTADAVRAEQSRTAAALAETKRQKQAAEAATAEAKAVNAFLTDDIIGAASPEVQRGRKLTVEEAVENAAAKVGETFKDRPLIEVGVRDALTRTLHALGRYDQAAVHAKAALDLHRRLHGEDDPRTLQSLARMGATLKNCGKLSEAEPVLREALSRSRRVLGDDHSNTLESLQFMGDLLDMQGKLSEAEPLYREILQRNRRLLGDDHRHTISSIGDLGHLLMNQGKLTEAEPLLREELERTRRGQGNDYPYALAINSMGDLLQLQRRFTEAEALYREALERDRRLLGDDHPNTLSSISDLGSVLEEQGKLSLAEPLYREGLERSRRVLGEDHPTTLGAVGDMGWLLMTQGKLSEAEPLMREELERRRRVLGDDHPTTINSIQRVGILLQTQDKLSGAEVLYREALERSRRVRRDDEPNMLILVDRMGALLRAQGNLADLERLYREALEDCTESLGPAAGATVDSLLRLEWMVADSGRKDEAEALLLGHARLVAGASPADAEARVVERLHALYAEWKPGARAAWRPKLVAARRRAWREEIDRLTGQIAKEPNVALPIYQRALVYGRSGRFVEAAADFRRVLELDPRDHMDWNHLACLLAYLGEADEHRAVCRDAFARFAADKAPEVGERLAKASLLLPGGAEDPAAAMRWMDRALAVAESGDAAADYGPWFRMSKGIAEYRAGKGHYQVAADSLKKAAADLGHHGHAVATCGYYRAMALHQLARPEEARAALDAAEQTYTGLGNTPGEDDLAAGGLENWLICQIARREAKALFDPAAITHPRHDRRVPQGWVVTYTSGSGSHTSIKTPVL